MVSDTWVISAEMILFLPCCEVKTGISYRLLVPICRHKSCSFWSELRVLLSSIQSLARCQVSSPNAFYTIAFFNMWINRQALRILYVSCRLGPNFILALTKAALKEHRVARGCRKLLQMLSGTRHGLRWIIYVQRYFHWLWVLRLLGRLETPSSCWRWIINEQVLTLRVGGR